MSEIREVRLSGLEPGRDIEIVFTGLRPGEKLTEELWTGTEDLEPTAQEKRLVIRRPEAEAAGTRARGPRGARLGWPVLPACP